jgi:hypothetical protein
MPLLENKMALLNDKMCYLWENQESQPFVVGPRKKRLKWITRTMIQFQWMLMISGTVHVSLQTKQHKLVWVLSKSSAPTAKYKGLKVHKETLFHCQS